MSTVGVDDVIEIRERSSARVANSVLKLLTSHQGFWSLVNDQIIVLKAVGPHETQISASGFIGECKLGEKTLRLVEKTPGAAVMLLEHCTADAFELLDLERFASEPGHLQRLIVTRFVSSVSNYCSTGRSFTYLPERNQSPRLTGRLLVGPTMRLRASGRAHLFLSESSALSRDTAEHCALYLALQTVEHIARSLHLPLDVISECRALGSLFRPGPRFQTKLLDTKNRQVEFIRALVNQCKETRTRILLRLSLLLVSGSSLELSRPTAIASPFSWFIKLHDLFEGAVREALGKSLPTGFEIRKWDRTDEEAYLFDTNRYRLKPDVIIRATNCPQLVAVGDVKYKNLENGRPLESDFYQLLSHARGLGAKSAFLVYPGSAYKRINFGAAHGIPNVHGFEVPIDQFEPTISLAARTICGILNAPDLTAYFGAIDSPTSIK